ncbi:hypothetical protein A8M57_15760 [Yersinia pestis]|nr:hypothetical protein EX92_19665 [Yersinia pestis subsp. pestis]KXF92336.1 hypothetical protein AU082_18075 [Yersinia pestis]KYO53218.1 hypothetical protein AU390_15770 [Yersinia pestis]KYP01570.1 hypothetical protein AU253_12225 [Yersinia pestis]KZB77470.1 hypothetical protein AVJ24_13935 [Yersinia pestis]
MQLIHYLLIISAVVNNKPSIHNINLTKMLMTSNFLISAGRFQPILIFSLCPEIKKTGEKIGWGEQGQLAPLHLEGLRVCND